MLTPVERRSLSDAVYQQLRDAIVGGEMEVGDALPSERVLCETLNVNRGAVREALKRLAEARLVQIHHGGATRVLDFRQTGGLGLLPALLLGPGGDVRPRVARAIVEMRGALAPDIARLAALRGGDAIAGRLDAIVAAMEDAGDDVAARQRLALDFWDALVDGGANVAYRLAFNTLREAYTTFMDLLTELMADEFTDLEAYAGIAAAVRDGYPIAAEAVARRLIDRGGDRLAGLFDAMDAADGQTAPPAAEEADDDGADDAGDDRDGPGPEGSAP